MKLPSIAMLQSRRRGQKAFTLIELLVVIVILAILAALIVPHIVGHVADAKRAKAASDVATLSSLLQQYKVDNDKYPTTEQGLNSLRVAPGDAPNWRGPYATKDIPADPWGNEYQYVSPGPNGEDYVITSYGADGAAGGDGDNADISSS